MAHEVLYGSHVHTTHYEVRSERVSNVVESHSFDFCLFQQASERVINIRELSSLAPKSREYNVTA